MRIVPPGDDVVPVPPPVDEVPPHDRFCDLVMTGGVASGVVYPWAIVQIARAYRFRNIGGTSVGAMAAVLAAAAEYGRRVGFDQSFEVLRRTPAALGEDVGDGRTRMLSLFQPHPKGRRLITLWGRIGRGQQLPDKTAKPSGDASAPKPPLQPPPPPQLVVPFRAAVCEVLCAYRWPMALGALGLVVLVMALVVALVLCTLLLGRLWPDCPGAHALGQYWHREWRLSALGWTAVILYTVLLLLGALAGLLWAIWRDVRFGLIDNNLGLCKGGTLEGPGPKGDRPGLCEWLHMGIQASAGLKRTDRPLTFRDLWCAPATPGAPHLPCADGDPLERRSINLQTITTNVTHGRPYRLPLADETSRLFYKPEELKDYFPEDVLDALRAASKPYAPQGASDPAQIPDAEQFLQLPGADLPLVVAARLSLSFPLLFAAVPMWAIDYEAQVGKRVLRRCLFTDGGASSNFPIHLFDAAMPRWPTFGLWLDRRDPHRPVRNDIQDEDVWLPEFHEQGRADNWNRFDPEAADPARSAAAGVAVAPKSARGQRSFLFGFLRGVASGAFNWQDRTSFRLPHVRNRVARLWLEGGEGGLHIGMSRQQILFMAHRYGSNAGNQFVERFKDQGGQAAPAWSEQRWVRLQLLIDGLRERLLGLTASADWSAHTVPLKRALATATATKQTPIRERGKHKAVTPDQSESLATLLTELERLEDLLREAEPQSFVPLPKPELRLRAPL